MPAVWVPSLITILLAVIAELDNPIQMFIKDHPHIAVWMAGLYALIKGILPQQLNEGEAVRLEREHQRAATHTNDPQS